MDNPDTGVNSEVPPNASRSFRSGAASLFNARNSSIDVPSVTNAYSNDGGYLDTLMKKSAVIAHSCARDAGEEVVECRYAAKAVPSSQPSSKSRGKSRYFNTLARISHASSTSERLITSGGARRMVFTCVSLASNPLSRKRSQYL